MKLEVIIEKDETGYFVAEVPALPGCFSQGNTFEEAEINIRKAIELWLEVMNDKNKGAQGAWRGFDPQAFTAGSAQHQGV